MRTLGIEVGGSDSLLVVLDGTAKSWKIEFMRSSKIPLPAAGDEIDRLIALKKLMHELLKLHGIDRVAVIRADRKSSPIRAKVECMIQLAANEAAIPCVLVAAQTVYAADKRKVTAVAGTTLAQTLQQIRPGYLRKAAHCAWSLANASE